MTQIISNAPVAVRSVAVPNGTQRPAAGTAAFIGIAVQRAMAFIARRKGRTIYKIQCCRQGRVHKRTALAQHALSWLTRMGRLLPPMPSGMAKIFSINFWTCRQNRRHVYTALPQRQLASHGAS